MIDRFSVNIRLILLLVCCFKRSLVSFVTQTWSLGALFLAFLQTCGIFPKILNSLSFYPITQQSELPEWIPIYEPIRISVEVLLISVEVAIICAHASDTTLIIAYANKTNFKACSTCYCSEFACKTTEGLLTTM